MRTWLRYGLTGAGVVMVAEGALEAGRTSSSWWMVLVAAGALVASFATRPDKQP